MAAAPPSRTRSLRATAPSLRPPRAQADPSPLAAHSSTASAAPYSSTGAPRGSSGSAASGGPSSLTLFLSNLRLLDLDLLEDWPDITAKTFQNTQGQGQKKRVHCVEWALFRLFEILDPEETRTKLRPLFPPQDQVSSLNLRSALLRALETAKKNGTLDRNTILRRTMLDDCKGERLEDVLAAFSTAVLRLVVSEEVAASGAYVTPALALALALAPKSYQDDRTDLTVLNLVLRKEVNGMLVERKERERRFRGFQNLLEGRERGLRRRMEVVKAAEAKQRSVGEDARREMEDLVRNNWTGHEQWMEAILYGDAATGEGGLFGMDFDRVWRRVEQDRLSELEDSNSGLLRTLEKRARGHEQRLAQWDEWRKGYGGGRARARERREERSAQRSEKKRGIDLGFRAHTELQVGRVKPARENPLMTQERSQNKSDLVARLARALREETGASPTASETLAYLFGPGQHKVGSSLEAAVPDEEVSEISDIEDHARAEEPPRPSPKRAVISGRLPTRPKLGRPRHQSLDDDSDPGPDDNKPTHAKTMAVPPAHGVNSRASPRSPEKKPQRSARPSLDIRARSPDSGDGAHEHEHAPIRLSPDAAPISPTQDAADKILLHLQNASPSPSKPSKPRHKLSLAERTRLSMVRGPSLFEETDDFAPLDTTTTTTDISPFTSPDEHAPQDPPPAEDLAARTRKSMHNFEKARAKGQVERRRSMRRSKLPPKRGDGRDRYFDKVDEDDGEEERAVVVEELLGEEDVERVFRSRPKIKASPVGSPMREHW